MSEKVYFSDRVKSPSIYVQKSIDRIFSIVHIIIHTFSNEPYKGESYS